MLCMKRQLIAALSLSTLALTACGGEADSQPPEEKMTEETAEEEEAEMEEEEADAKDTIEINEQVVDDENITAEFVDIDHIYNEVFDHEKYEVNFDVTNHTDDTIKVQARNVSINDNMVDNGIISMSQDIAADKSATATLTIDNYDEDTFPELENNFEMELHILNEADFEDIGDYPVSVDLNE